MAIQAEEAAYTKHISKGSFTSFTALEVQGLLRDMIGAEIECWEPARIVRNMNHALFTMIVLC